MKQTAVEWLENQIKTSKYFYKLMGDINIRVTVAQSDIFEQAKAMHREEIINSFFEGAYGGDNISGEQYYTEQFKTK